MSLIISLWDTAKPWEDLPDLDGSELFGFESERVSIWGSEAIADLDVSLVKAGDR